MHEIRFCCKTEQLVSKYEPMTRGMHDRCSTQSLNIGDLKLRISHDYPSILMPEEIKNEIKNINITKPINRDHSACNFR